jgi:hypothetical protein
VRLLFLEESFSEESVAIVQLEGKTTKTEFVAEECEQKGAPVDKSPVTAGEAREKVAKLVWGSADAITKKLIEVATEEGQLGHVKYLFEIAGIHPAGSDETTSKPEESVIYSWLKELGMPEGTQGKDARQEDGAGERIL